MAQGHGPVPGRPEFRTRAGPGACRTMRTSHGALVVPLRPVEERFARALPGQLQQMTTAVYVLDGAGLRDTAGRLDFPAVRGHLTWWLRAHEYNATRLVSSALGLTPPAWVSAAEPLDRAIELWPHPCGAAEVDSVVAALQQVPIALRTSPVHVTVVDAPAGPVVLVLRASHAWTDGLLGLHILQQLTGGQPGPLHTPPHDPPVTGPLGPVALALSLLRMWWADQPSWRAAARSWLSRSPKDRARRVLGRQRWTLTLSLARLRRSAVPVTPELGLHRLELPLDTVSRYARACGGNGDERPARAGVPPGAAAAGGQAGGGAPRPPAPPSPPPAPPRPAPHPHPGGSGRGR